jgi:hypothetical protein
MASPGHIQKVTAEGPGTGILLFVGEGFRRGDGQQPVRHCGTRHDLVRRRLGDICRRLPRPSAP